MRGIADLLLATGLFSLFIAGAILFALVFGGDGPSMLTSKNLRKALVDDYKNKKVVARGPLGLIKFMIILALILAAGGGLIKLLLMAF